MRIVRSSDLRPRRSGRGRRGQQAAQTAAGTLRVGVIESVANSILPPLLSTLASHNPDLDVRARQADQGVLRLVASGAGVGLVPDLGLRRLPDGLRLVELKEPVSRRIELVWRRSSTARPAIQAVVDAVSAVADDMGLDR